MIFKIVPLAVVLCSFVFSQTAYCAEPKSEPAFKDRTAELGLELANGAACWADLDNDGWTDLCAGGTAWKNNAGKGFTKLAEGLGEVVAADFDNDGFVDLFSWTTLRVLRNNAGKEFTAVELPELPKCVSRGACWGDFNNDGFVDLFVGGYEEWEANVTYPDLVLMNDKGKSFKLAWSEAKHRARGVTACDLDQDGDLDVYVSNYRLQPNVLWRNDGTGKFKNEAAALNALATSEGFAGGHSIGACWGDFDNDGRIDLFAGNFAHVDNRGDQPKSRFLRNTGPAKNFVFEDKGPCGVFYQESYASPCTADYDNDGDLDLFFTTVYAVASFGRPNHPVLFRNDGGFSFADATAAAKLPSLEPTYQAAWADFDHDGDLDLVSAGKLFENQGAPGHWLGVRLVGDSKTVSRSAIGAQVRVKLKDRTLTRQVEAGTGEGNQNDLTLHFGLGETAQPVDLEIVWPKGTTQTVAGVEIDRIVDIPFDASLKLGQNPFTISLWVHAAARSADQSGDLVSQFDAKTRTGFHLSLRNNTGVTHSQANYRQLQFGIDAGTEPVFTDHGRPGSAVYGQSMAVHDGHLYVGTCEPGAEEAGHVYRHDGVNKWFDCGSPDKANSITAMAAHDGALYVGSGKYRLGGSALSESENPNLGGKIYRHLGEQKWEEVGRFPDMECVGGMVVYRGSLYVGSLYKPAAFFRYEGDKKWSPLEVPAGKRVEALGVYNGYLWATGYDEGHVYRFDGQSWTDLGRVGEEENTQTYAFVPYQGLLHVATWRTGKVFRRLNDAWEDRGRLGEELEVMGMLVHNGALYAGTLPSGQIYRHDGDAGWTMLKQLDTTPDVKYRRVWTMAQYQGELFATTLPSGHVWSMRTGAGVTWDKEFPAGWHHVAAQRTDDRLRLFVDGEQVAESAPITGKPLDLTSGQPWRIGAGSGDFFGGSLAEVRVDRRTLTAEEIRELAKGK